MKKWVGIGAVVFLAGVLILAGSLAAFGWDVSKMSPNTQYEKKEIIIEDKNQSIIIIDNNTSFIIGKSSDKQIHFEYYENEKASYEIGKIGDITFTKQTHYRWYDFIFNFDMPAFTILLPENFAGSIEINTGNAGIEAKNITASNITFNTSNGLLNINNVQANRLWAKTNNGSVKASGINVKNTCMLATSNGKITADNVLAGELNAKTNNSAIEVSDADIKGSVYLQTNNGGINVAGLSAINEITLKTSNGSITGNIMGNMSDFAIMSKTSNGSNNLPESAVMGSKNLNVNTSNGNIKIDFIQ